MSTDGVRWDAAEYARNSSAQREWARELIGKLGLSGRESVLDLGCGDGKVTAEIVDAGGMGTTVGTVAGTIVTMDAGVINNSEVWDSDVTLYHAKKLLPD